MHVVTVLFQIHPGRFPEFLAAMRHQQAASLARSAGCRQFDIAHDGSGSVFLYEVYDRAEDFAHHLQTPHFRDFATVTAEMVAAKTVSEWQMDRSGPDR